MSESTPSVRAPLRAASGVQQVMQAARNLLREPAYRVVVVACLLIGLSVSFVLPFMSMFGTGEVGMSLPVFGTFMTASALVNIAISTALSQRSDTSWSRRALLLLGSAAGALGYLLYAFVRDVWVLFFTASIVLGVASVTFAQLFAHARELLTRSTLPPSDAPLYMNTFRMCFALSWTVGPAIAAVTLRVLDFEGLFLTASALHVCVFLLVFKFVPPIAPAPRTTNDTLPLTQILGQRGILPWFVALAFISAAHTISLNNMSLYVLKDLGGSASHVGVIFSLAPLFELPFMLYFGLLATRAESGRLIRLALALAIGYYALLSLVRAPWQIYPLQIVSAAIVSVTSGVAITFFQDKLPSRPGLSTTLYSNATRIGATSGFLVFGTIAGYFGHRGAYVACSLIAAAALLLTFSASRKARAEANFHAH